jgi:hypothetical protein
MKYKDMFFKKKVNKNKKILFLNIFIVKQTKTF